MAGLEVFPMVGRSSRNIVLAVVLGVLIGLFGVASAQSLTVRLAWYMPPGTATAKQGEAIAKYIEQMSNGSITVKTYPSGSLLSESTMAEGIQNNTVNMGILGMHWWSNVEPALDWDTVPFLESDAGTLLKALNGPLGDEVKALLEKHGVTVAGWGFYGYAMSYVNTEHPIKTPSDLKGLKMRSEGQLNAAFLKQEGATPVAMDSGEVYTALQRGTLNGATSGLSSIVSRKWYEVGKYITAIHYVPLVYPVQANQKWWNGLSQSQRDIISKAAEKAAEDNVANIEAEFKNDIQVAQSHGDQIYQPTGAELDPWKKATAFEQQLYLKDAGADGQKILDTIKSLNASGN